MFVFAAVMSFSHQMQNLIPELVGLVFMLQLEKKILNALMITAMV